MEVYSQTGKSHLVRKVSWIDLKKTGFQVQSMLKKSTENFKLHLREKNESNKQSKNIMKYWPLKPFPTLAVL